LAGLDPSVETGCQTHLYMIII